MTNIKGTATGNAVEVEIEIEAPAEAVFDFLVVPEKLLRWMGQEADLDPRPGGELRIHVGGSDTAIGRYAEVVRPKKVSFSWGWEGSELVPPGSSMVEISLREAGGVTVVTLVHTDLPDPEAGTQHLEGWLHFGALLGDVAEAEAQAGASAS
jgi:uncharacterized protein YndB with AHSA1/START domain